MYWVDTSKTHSSTALEQDMLVVKWFNDTEYASKFELWSSSGKPRGHTATETIRAYFSSMRAYICGGVACPHTGAAERLRRLLYWLWGSQPATEIQRILTHPRAAGAWSAAMVWNLVAAGPHRVCLTPLGERWVAADQRLNGAEVWPDHATPSLRAKAAERITLPAPFEMDLPDYTAPWPSGSDVVALSRFIAAASHYRAPLAFIHDLHALRQLAARDGGWVRDRSKVAEKAPSSRDYPFFQHWDQFTLTAYHNFLIIEPPEFHEKTAWW
ncbi:hypothetical protein Lfu02_01910 [Longispora fulva]|nr:hypothetical protein Lfu02_01910 [Longispora fulva]